MAVRVFSFTNTQTITMSSTNTPQAEGQTRTVQVKLVAFTRREYVETITVPSAATPQELQGLLDMRYSAVDGGDYLDDPEYWKKGDCEIASVTGDTGLESSLQAELHAGQWQLIRAAKA